MPHMVCVGNCMLKWDTTLHLLQWLKYKTLMPAPVAHACNPSYSRGRDQEDHGSKPAQPNSLQDPILKKTCHKKGLMEWLKPLTGQQKLPFMFGKIQNQNDTTTYSLQSLSLTIQSRNTPGYLPTWVEKLYPHRKLYRNV
jgi:hypothetical protein